MLSNVLMAALAAQPPVVSAPADPAPSAAIEAPVAQTVKVPALTPVSLMVMVDLQSKTAVIGEEFDIALATPITLPGGYEVPAGTPGRGWIIHADRAKMGGRAGELLLGARYLDLKGVRIPLRSMRLSVNGDDKTGLAHGMVIAGGALGGTAAMFITGSQARVANRAPAVAKTASDIDIPVALLGRSAPAAIVVVTAPPAPPQPSAESK